MYEQTKRLQLWEKPKYKWPEGWQAAMENSLLWYAGKKLHVFGSNIGKWYAVYIAENKTKSLLHAI